MDVNGFPVRLVGEGMDWPASVQAIGSVAAIFFAVQVARKERLDRAAARVTALHSVLQFARQTIADAAKAYEDAAAGALDREFDLKRFDHAEAALRAIPIFEIGQDRVAGMVFDMLGRVQRMKEIGVPGRYELLLADFTDHLREVRENDVQSRAIIAGTGAWHIHAVRRARSWWVPFI